MTFTRQILLGLFLGIALGLFFGEWVGGLSMLGDVYIGLLQMTVLPYIMLSLIVNLGQISWSEGRGLLTTLVAVFLVFLLGGGAVLFMTPLAFPPTQAASFFSNALVQARLNTGYLVPPDDEQFARYVDEWTKLKRGDGTTAALFEHWIRGGGSRDREPRWSVARNVMGWGHSEAE